MSNSKYKFTPATDIRADELAQLLPYLISEWRNAVSGPTTIIENKEVAENTINLINALDPNLVKRHFIK